MSWVELVLYLWAGFTVLGLFVFGVSLLAAQEGED